MQGSIKLGVVFNGLRVFYWAAIVRTSTQAAEATGSRQLTTAWSVDGVPRLGMTIRVRVPDIRRVPDSMGMGTDTIFYPWVAPVLDPKRDGYGTGIFSHPWVTRRVPDTLLAL
jgi:hypothetical protein